MSRRCANCSYRLRGLPDGHACPECGFVLEPGASVFEPGPRITMKLLMGAIALVWLTTAAFVTASRSQPLAMLANGAVALAIAVWLGRRLWTRAHSVVVGSGIVFWDSAGKVLHLPINRIWRADYAPLSSEVKLVQSDGTTLATIPPLRGRTHDVMIELARVINEHVDADTDDRFDGPATYTASKNACNVADAEGLTDAAK
jgi:hypothetical protein